MGTQLELDFTTNTGLTKDEKLLLDFINEYADYRPNKWITPSIIQLTYPNVFGSTSENEHNDGGRAYIRDVIYSLRKKGELIISSPRGYKRGGEKETRLFVERYFNSALRKLKVAWEMKDKLSKNGQLEFKNDGIEKVEAWVNQIKKEMK